MKKNYFKSKIIIAGLLLFVVQSALKSQGTVTQTFIYTGAMQSFTVPPCVGSMTISAWAAKGGDASIQGANGGFARGVITATPGQVMYFFAGGQGSVTAGGFNGGGVGGIGSSSSGAGGGGASDVRINGFALANRIIVAGAGGGNGGSANYNPSAGAGGAGNTFTSTPGFGGGFGGGCASGTAGGETGGTATSYGTGGAGGGLTSGGALAGSSSGGYGDAGTLGTGGGGGGTSGAYGGGGGGVNGGGGGGAGYYGGSGGMSGTGGCNGGGGGGSSWINNSLLSSSSFSGGISVGHGSITIVYAFNGTGVTATASPGAICNGSATTINASGVISYTWDTGANSSNIIVSPSVTTSYTVQGTNSIGCTSNAVITITVSPALPVLSVSSSTNNLCLGKTATLTATGALTYTWTGGVINAQSFFPSVTSSYTVTGENGCGTTTAVTSITVAPLPVTAVSSSSSICAGYPATLTAAAAATGYTWTPFPALLSGTMVTVNPSLTTLYTVTASDGTCAGTATLLLTVNPIPTISVVANVSLVCEGYPVNMTANGGLSYTWMPGNLSGPSVTVYPTAPILYTVVGSNSFGCVAGAPQILLTNPSPTITISANNTFVCPGTAVNITAGGGSTYVWGNGPTTPGIAVNPTVTTSYNVVGTGQSGTCTATKTITIVVFDPAFTITGPSTICSGSNATLIASGADTYLWDNGANVNLIVVTPSVNTTYTVSATTSTNNITCSATNTIQVLVSPRPIVTAASSRTLICKFESSLLTAGGAVSYTWNTSATSATITVTPTVPVLFTYSVTGTDASGCTNIATTQVKVNPCNGINETAMKGVQLLVYPNPNKGEFMIETDSEITLNMVNELGQVVKTINLSASNNFKAPVSDLANGIYFVSGKNNSGKVNQKIVVNK